MGKKAEISKLHERITTLTKLVLTNRQSIDTLQEYAHDTRKLVHAHRDRLSKLEGRIFPTTDGPRLCEFCSADAIRVCNDCGIQTCSVHNHICGITINVP